LDKGDYERFQLLLFLANRNEPLNMREILSRYRGRTFADIFKEERCGHEFADVLAYTCMPNHTHLLLRQTTDDGITTYMKRVFVAYAMYFNLKYSRSGVLFQGRFKSKHVDSEPYFRYIFSYIHLNPLSLVEPDWEKDVWGDRKAAKDFLNNYQYSSFVDYSVKERPQRSIISDGLAADFLNSQNEIEELFRWYSVHSETEFTKVAPL
jgi:REP element-mobilizing transposase RayT